MSGDNGGNKVYKKELKRMYDVLMRLCAVHAKNVDGRTIVNDGQIRKEFDEFFVNATDAEGDNVMKELSASLRRNIKERIKIDDYSKSKYLKLVFDNFKANCVKSTRYYYRANKQTRVPLDIIEQNWHFHLPNKEDVNSFSDTVVEFEAYAQGGLLTGAFDDSSSVDSIAAEEQNLLGTPAAQGIGGKVRACAGGQKGRGVVNTPRSNSKFGLCKFVFFNVVLFF